MEINTLLKKEIKSEIRKLFEMNENDTYTKIYRMQQK